MTYAIASNDKKTVLYNSNWEFPVGKRVQFSDGTWGVIKEIFATKQAQISAWNKIVEKHNTIVRAINKINRAKQIQNNIETWEKIASSICSENSGISELDVLQTVHSLGCI